VSCISRSVGSFWEPFGTLGATFSDPGVPKEAEREPEGARRDAAGRPKGSRGSGRVGRGAGGKQKRAAKERRKPRRERKGAEREAKGVQNTSKMTPPERDSGPLSISRIISFTIVKPMILKIGGSILGGQIKKKATSERTWRTTPTESTKTWPEGSKRTALEFQKTPTRNPNGSKGEWKRGPKPPEWAKDGAYGTISDPK